MTLRLSPEERARLRKAAQANRQSLSEFARDAIVTAAEDTLEDEDPSDAATSPWA